MEIDTVSPVCLISGDVHNRHRQSWSSLQSTRLKLSCYVGKLPVWGKLTLNVSYNGKTCTSTLYVLYCSCPSLCGRDFLSNLNQFVTPVPNLGAELKTHPDDYLNKLLLEYEDLFSSSLELLSGPPAHFQLKEGTAPKLFKARPLSYAMRYKVSWSWTGWLGLDCCPLCRIQSR